jgi:hypothetical protein
MLGPSLQMSDTWPTDSCGIRRGAASGSWGYDANNDSYRSDEYFLRLVRRPHQPSRSHLHHGRAQPHDRCCDLLACDRWSDPNGLRSISHFSRSARHPRWIPGTGVYDRRVLTRSYQRMGRRVAVGSPADSASHCSRVRQVPSFIASGRVAPLRMGAIAQSWARCSRVSQRLDPGVLGANHSHRPTRLRVAP